MKDVLRKQYAHIGSVKDNLRELAAVILRKVDIAGQHLDSISVFVDPDGDVWAARSQSQATLNALKAYPNALVGVYSVVTFKPDGSSVRQSRRDDLPTADELAEDIAQHENSFAVVNAFLAEAA